jgi:hypothetical protein
MARFRIDIHAAPDVAGNLVGRAHRFPIRASIEYDSSDNAAATDAAIALTAEHGQPGDITRILRCDDDQWRVLGEHHYAVDTP